MQSRYVVAALLTGALGGCRGVTDLGMPRIGTEYTLVSYTGAPLPAVQFAASYHPLTILDSHLRIFGDTAFLEMRIRNHITAQAAYIDSATSKLTVVEHGDSVRMDYVCDRIPAFLVAFLAAARAAPQSSPSTALAALPRSAITWADARAPAHWSAPVPVAPAGGDRINVEMSIDATTGRIDLMTNHRSWSGNRLFDVTYLTSADGGQSWATQRVTRSSWDPSRYGVPSGSGIRPFIGDYDGIVSLADRAGLVWTGPGPTVGAVPDNLDAFYATLLP